MGKPYIIIVENFEFFKFPILIYIVTLYMKSFHFTESFTIRSTSIPVTKINFILRKMEEIPT